MRKDVRSGGGEKRPKIRLGIREGKKRANGRERMSMKEKEMEQGRKRQ